MNTQKRQFRYSTYIEPVIKPPIVKTYGFPILTTVAIITFLLFAIKPTVETILTLQKDLSNQKQILSKATKKSEALSVAITNYRLIDTQKLSTIASLVPDNPGIQTIITSLENAARVPEASISAIQFQPISYEKLNNSTNTLSEIQFTYNIEGTFASLKKVLQNLGSSTRLIIINSVNINKLERSGGLLMSISGKTYYLHQ